MNHHKQLLAIIKEKEKTATFENGGSEIEMFRHLVEMLGEEKFNSKFESYFINNNELFDNCFHDFHKSMRQIDFYDEFYRRETTKNADGKRIIEYERIGGHLDMLFWNLIQISEEPYLMLNKLYTICVAVKAYSENIGKKVTKCSIGRQEENSKPFKSGLLVNTVKDVVMHDFLDIPAYTFEEDNTMVECRRCKVVE